MAGLPSVGAEGAQGLGPLGAGALARALVALELAPAAPPRPAVAEARVAAERRDVVEGARALLAQVLALLVLGRRPRVPGAVARRAGAAEGPRAVGAGRLAARLLGLAAAPVAPIDISPDITTGL